MYNLGPTSVAISHLFLQLLGHISQPHTNFNLLYAFLHSKSDTEQVNYTLYSCVPLQTGHTVFTNMPLVTLILFTSSPPGKLTEDKSKTESSLEFVSTFHRFC